MKMRNLVIVDDSRIFRRYWEQWYRNNPKYERAVDAEFRAIRVEHAARQIDLEVTAMNNRDTKRPLNVVFLGNHIDPAYFYDAISSYQTVKRYAVDRDWFSYAVSNYKDKQTAPISTYKIDSEDGLQLSHRNLF